MIEGYRAARLAFGGSGAQSVSVGFWVYATVAGTMTVALLNSASNRAILHDIVINSATTWEYKTVTFGGDASGTWLATTGTGLRVRFCFGAGSNFHGLPDAWTAAEIFATSSTTNFFASNNNVACITGLAVLPGIELPDASRSPLIARPFPPELELCKRHYWCTFVYGTAPAQGVGLSTGELIWNNLSGTSHTERFSCPFPAPLGAVPTITLYNPAAANAQIRDESAAADLSASGSTNTTAKATTVFGTSTSSPAAKLGVHISADARLT